MDPFGLAAGGNIRHRDPLPTPTASKGVLKAVKSATAFVVDYFFGDLARERKKGHMDVVEGAVMSAVDEVYLAVHPRERLERMSGGLETMKEFAEDPEQLIDTVESATKNYIDDFDGRDLGQVEGTIGIALIGRYGRADGLKTAATSRIRGMWTRLKERFGPKCFAAGTLVLTATGMVPIEDIGVGDLVYSRDDVTHEESYQPVLQTFETPDKAVWDVEFTTDTGGSEILTTTYGHPFGVVGDG